MEKETDSSPLVSMFDDDIFPHKKLFDPKYMGITLDRNNIIISG